MKISTKGRYALRIMIDIAVNSNGENVSLKDITQRQGISAKYSEQIISQLSKVGYLKSARGSLGGYKLAKTPEEYPVGDILRITEGSLAPIACLDDEENQCPRRCQCDTIDFWGGLYNVINEYINQYTLADLLTEHNKNKIDDYII